MKLSKHNRDILMLALHQKIEEYAESTSNHLDEGLAEDILVYPPNAGLSKEEMDSLECLKGNSVLKSALRKVLADNSAGLLFELMNFIDGTADPDENSGNWTEVSLVDKSKNIQENSEMLHDSFFSSYWDWKELKRNEVWKLDNHE